VEKIALSGIKPTGTLHIGNYLGMIKPAFDLIENYQTLYFVADYHALTTLKDKQRLNRYVYDDECNVYNIFKYFASPEAIESRHKAYLNGGLAYGEIKQELFELLNDVFGRRRDAYLQLRDDKHHLDHILNQGAESACAIAGPILENVRRAIGISR